MKVSKISIIVPVYNAEATLLRCINSLLSQTFKDFELILVDDCSNDNSRLLMKKCSEEDDRIKCLYADINAGGGAARNMGLNVATGDFVMFTDSDDWVAPDWVECLYEAQKSHPSCLVMSNLYDCMNGKNVARMGDFHEDHIIEIDYFDLYSKFHLDGFLWNKIFERSVIELNAIRFNVLRKEGEDVDFIFRYIYSKKISNFCLIEKTLYYYWRDSENCIQIHIIQKHWKRICTVSNAVYLMSLLKKYLIFVIFIFLISFQNLMSFLINEVKCLFV